MVDPLRPGERGPAVALEEPVERPFGTPVGGAQRPRQPRRRRPGRGPSSPRRGAPRCTRTESSLVGVVEVQPAAVRLLVADEPVDGGLRRAPELGGGDRRAALRRRDHRERDDEQQRQAQRRASARGGPRQRRDRLDRSAAPRRRGAADGGQEQRRAARTTPSAAGGSAPTRRPAPRGARAVAVHDLERASRAEPARRGSGPASRARAPARASRRWPRGGRVDAEHPVARRRHRPDHEHGDAEEREDLHRRRHLDRRRGRRPRPTPPRSACRATTGRPR